MNKRKSFNFVVSIILFLAACVPATNSPVATEPAPEGSVEILISSSNTKEDWMNEMVAQFNAGDHNLSSGEKVFVRVTHVTSGGSQKDILEGKSQPTVWSPGDQSWIDGANMVWKDRSSRLIVSESCPATVLAPIGFAMWRPMAKALGWPNKPISWDDLVNLAANPDGWESKGHPEWGQFKFGHTHPGYSNTGMLMMTALAYSEMNKTSGLTVDQVYQDRVVNAFRFLEQNTYHYGKQNRPLAQILAKNGPDYLHAITSSEAEVLKTNAEFADTMRFPLVFVFPSKGTYWSEQPYCILEAEWVTDKQREGAEIFRDFILAPSQQNLAIDYYLRPVDEKIQLHDPFTIDNGTNPNVTRSDVVSLESPTGDLSNAVIDVFLKTKKKATTLMILDVSGSMDGDKIASAVESSINFISRLDPDDEIYLMVFGGNGVRDLGGGRAGAYSETLEKTLAGLFASGDTPLYEAICTGMDKINSLANEDKDLGEKRLYGIVLLSDGDNTSGNKSQNEMFSTCLPTGENVEGVKLFTIAYGDNADIDLMIRIANRTNGKSFTGDPKSIENVYLSISAEQ